VLQLSVLLVIIGAVVALSALFVWISPWRGTRIPTGVALGIAGVIVALGVGYVVVETFAPGGLRPTKTARPDSPIGPHSPFSAPGEFPAGPLGVGMKAPPLQAAGWLNAPPASADAAAAKLIVVDLWAHW
jgi:hypothetical protein